MNEHTPGPWFIHPEPYIFAFAISDHERREIGMGIASITHARLPGAAEANARLIAAAPTLLRALQSIASLSKLGMAVDADHAEADFAAIAATAATAIAAATGARA